ncbi:MAG: tetratricopeptide repeat protein, partial [Candidatus Omnitrophica bacterium]|nr:tetratricopeptide repeat protein [Candidatus Omnitrophota bacterium]
NLGRARFLLGRSYAQERRFPEALAESSRGLHIMEEYVTKARNPKVRDLYRHFLKTAHFDQGQCFVGMGDLARANKEYLIALHIRLEQMASRDVEASDSLIASNLGMNCIWQNDRKGARRFFQLAVAADPRNVQALNNLGMFYFQAQRTGLARLFFERALKVDPLFRPAWENLKKVEHW